MSWNQNTSPNRWGYGRFGLLACVALLACNNESTGVTAMSDSASSTTGSMCGPGTVEDTGLCVPATTADETTGEETTEGMSGSDTDATTAGPSTTEEPTTEEPTTEDPTTEEPTTEDPTTEDPTTEDPTDTETDTDTDTDTEGELDYDGTFSLTPPPSKFCAFGLVDFNITEVTFATQNNDLFVIGPPQTLEQSPPPDGPDFDAQIIIPGGCTETYRLVGSFSDLDNFTATFSAEYQGQGNNCADCTSEVWEVVGERI